MLTIYNNQSPVVVIRPVAQPGPRGPGISGNLSAANYMTQAEFEAIPVKVVDALYIIIA